MKAESFKLSLTKATDTIQDLIDMMPQKGDTSEDCQRMTLQNALSSLDACINGIEQEDLMTEEELKWRFNPEKIEYLDDFIATKKKVANVADNPTYEGDFNIQYILEYSGGCHIGKYKGHYDLILENRNEIGRKKHLEVILWDWYKWQLRLDEDQIFNDLEVRAANLLYDLDLECNLNEVRRDKLSKKNVNKVNYLLCEYRELNKRDFDN